MIATVYAHGSKNRINFRRSDSAIYSSVSLVWSGASERQFCACKGNLERDKSRVNQIDISLSLVRGIAEAVLLPLGNGGLAPGRDGNRI